VSGILPFLDADDERRLLEGDVDGVTFEPTRVVRAWLDKAHTTHAPPILALLGDVGTGKTFAAALVIAEFGGQYVKAEELARLSLARFGQEHATFERLLACEVLVVDELALNLHRAEDERHALHTVIDARRQHATILVGNGNREILREHLNERTYDRFEKLGVAATFAGPSRREASKRAGWSASARDRSDARSATARSPHSIPAPAPSSAFTSTPVNPEMYRRPARSPHANTDPPNWHPATHGAPNDAHNYGTWNAWIGDECPNDPAWQPPSRRQPKTDQDQLNK
jgi:hypothetical protein